MVSGGVRVNQVAKVRLMLEVKFGNIPLAIFGDWEEQLMPNLVPVFSRRVYQNLQVTCE